MYIVDVIDPAEYSTVTVHFSLQDLCKKMDWEYVPVELWTAHKNNPPQPQRQHDKGIIVFAAARLKIDRVKTSDLKAAYPTAKLVCLGSDTIWYLKGRSTTGMVDRIKNTEFMTPYDCDLFLDLIDEVVDAYNSKGINSDTWMWSVSERLLNDFLSRPRGEPTKDFIGLWHLNNMTRHNIWHTIDRAGKTSIRSGQVNYNLDELFSAYASCRFTIGTTSPSWTTPYRTMKGFRDWIGPPCGSVLIYDNHPDILRKYTCCPTYDYNRPDEIITLAKTIDREAVLREQVQWAKDYCIDKQFLRLFRKHKLV